MEYKQLRHNFICFLKERYDYARPEAMASNVFYTWHNDIGIIVERNGKVYPIELKYKTLAMDCSIEGECYSLKSHGAQDIGKYDCLMDIQRLEQCSEMLPNFGRGFVIWLTNDPAYWKAPRKAGTMAEKFTLHDGVCKNGIMRWAPHTGAGTQKGREDPVILRDSYTIRWRHYSIVSDGKAGKLQYVLLSIK